VTGDFANDDAVFLGTILGNAGDDVQTALERAAFLAAEELNSESVGGGLPKASGGVRPRVVGGCTAAPGVLGSTRHLVVHLHAPAIVGPMAAEDVVDATQQVSMKGGTLLMTPTSLASSIAQLADDDLTWRDVSSDAQRAKLVIEQMNEIENVLHATR